jgi:hypothetical protein
MKKKIINDLLGDEFLIDIKFLPRTGSVRLPFDSAVFSCGRKLNKKEFGKFYRLLMQGHLEEARTFVAAPQEFEKLNKQRRQIAASKGGRAAMLDPKNYVCNKNGTHWNRGTVGLVKAWNKGLTKNTDVRCKNISIAKMGAKNPMYGRPVSALTREKLSLKAKQNIESGKWTPNTFNSRTRKQLKFRDKLFRSSWEALFYQAFPQAEYEKIRIPYFTDKHHVYITDFKVGNVIYEIKPEKYVKLKQPILDIVARWCVSNGFEFVILTEFSLTELIPKHTVNFSEFDENTEKLLRGLYASVEKRRNR